MDASGTRVAEPESDLGRSFHATRDPDPRLVGLPARPYVGFRQEGSPSEPWLEPPQPAVTLMISLEGHLSAGGQVLPQAWVGGLGDTWDLVECSGTYASFDLKLNPLGVYRLLGRPINDLAGTVAGLDDVFGAGAHRLGEQVGHAQDSAHGFDIIEAFLLQRWVAGPRPDPIVEAAWSRLRETSGRLPVATLAAELGCSRRHLTQRFRQQVGQPPKTVARLLRFQRVRRLIETNPVRWADIAGDCGYCDQSHLNRDFRDLAGTTPGDYVNRRISAGPARSEAVTFVQDGDAGPG